MTPRYVAFEGNIGAGKTTLATKMANEFGAQLILEEFEQNPFLRSFYKNPERYAFSVEMSFLEIRYEQLRKFAEQNVFEDICFSDYSIYKSLVFAQNNLKGKERLLYNKMFNIISSNLKQPDLVIYLSRPASTLQRHIAKRGREFELGIDNEYLTSIDENYISCFKQNTNRQVVLIEADKFDFLANPDDWQFLKGCVSRDFKPGLNFL